MLAEGRSYFLEDMGNWLHLNCTSVSFQHGILWKITFHMGVWHLWLHRNAYIFKNGIVDNEFFMHCRRKAAEFLAIAVEGRVQAKKHLQEISWAKLNTDGLAHGSTRGGGGILRDEHGNWINGFARNCGKVNSVMAELWALRDGLHMAAMQNTHYLIVELNALAVVQLMKSSIANLSLEPLLTNCRLLLKKFPHLRVEHVYREANKCADALANIGSNSNVPFILFAYPPPVVDRLCTLDIEGAFCNRLILF